jgi:hypothetical protein
MPPVESARIPVLTLVSPRPGDSICKERRLNLLLRHGYHSTPRRDPPPAERQILLVIDSGPSRLVAFVSEMFSVSRGDFTQPSAQGGAVIFHQEAFVPVPAGGLMRHVFFTAVTPAERAAFERIAETAAFQ